MERKITVFGLLAALFASSLMITAEAEAQLMTDRILMPPGGIASSTEAHMLSYNPAAMTLNRGWEIEYMHAEVSPHQSMLPGKGDAIYIVGNVFGPLYLGLGLEFVRPPHKALVAHHEQDLSGSSWTMATFAMGLKLGSAMSFGTSIRSWFSPGDRERMHGLVSWDAALHIHSCRYWSAFVGVYDITAPTKGGIEPIERTWALGAAFRPLGRDFFTVSIDDLLGEKSHANHLRISIEGEPFRGLSLVASASLLFGDRYPWVPDPRSSSGKYELRDVQISVGLKLDMSRIGYWSGFTLSTMNPGDGWGDGPLMGWAVGVRLSGQVHKTIMEPKRYVVLDLEGGASASSVVTTALWLERLGADPRVAGVVIKPRDFSASPGAIQDLRVAIDGLKGAGKQVVCHSDATTGSAYYLCSAADAIYLGPAGGVRISGYKTRLTYFTGLLRKLGVNVQMLRIGKYKSFPEKVTLEGPSDASVQEHMVLLEAVWATLVEDIAAGRGIEPDEMAEILARGPFNAAEAVELGLADAIIYEDELSTTLEDLLERRVLLDDSYFDTPVKPDQWGPGPRHVGVITISGAISEGKSRTVPLLGIHTTGDETIVKVIDGARKNPQIASVVLRVESGGGSAVAGDRIWRAVQQLAEKKPVIASFGGMAASAAYYISAPATEIVASPSTMTGSIGIYYGKADLSGLLDKLGVGVTVLETGGDKVDMESWHRPYTDDEVAFLQKQLEYFYNLFLERVAAGRGKTREQVHEIGQGRIWSGAAALENGLVDSNGGLLFAIDRARTLGDVPDWVAVKDLTPPPGLFEKLVASIMAKSDDGTIKDLAAMLAQSTGMIELFPTAMFLLRQEETPLALCPVTLSI